MTNPDAMKSYELNHHVTSTTQLREWAIFREMREQQLLTIKSFAVIHSPPFKGCTGGVSAIFIDSDDHVFAMGHNCSHINILGCNGFHFKRHQLSSPVIISDLSKKGVSQMTFGSLVGAALTDGGTLYFWGLCDRAGTITLPHTPRLALGRRFRRVSCGERMVVVLSFSFNVYVWGQLVNDDRVYMEGERVLTDSPMADISCGLHHLAMINLNGFVYSWGRGDMGQRGLANYTTSDTFVVNRMTHEPCIDVKCGPKNTICLTKSHEVRTCGVSCEVPSGSPARSDLIKTLSRVHLQQEVTKIDLVWFEGTRAKIAACASTGDIYIWGFYPHPLMTPASSLFETYTFWKLTPRLIHIDIPKDAKNFQTNLQPTLVPEIRSKDLSDLLTWVYFKDRQDRSEGSNVLSQFKCELQPVARSFYHLLDVEEGKNFILEKFLSDTIKMKQLKPVGRGTFSYD